MLNAPYLPFQTQGMSQSGRFLYAVACMSFPFSQSGWQLTRRRKHGWASGRLSRRPRSYQNAGELELFRWSFPSLHGGAGGATGGNWRGSEVGLRRGSSPLSEFRVLAASQRPDSSRTLQGKTRSAQGAVDPGSSHLPAQLCSGSSCFHLPVQADVPPGACLPRISKEPPHSASSECSH